MDPYLERPEIWPDFHDSFVAYIREALQPRLRPRYVALTQDRLYVVEHRRPIRPDVSVVRTGSEEEGGVATAVEPKLDRPLVFEIVEEQVRQPLIHIIEPAAGNRIVTAIEVLSPDNKSPGPGRDSYLQKRAELWQAGTHLVEIDLLRGGERLLRVSDQELEGIKPWCYIVAVWRYRSCYELYPFGLKERLPCVGIPLAHGDPDVPLELQAVFTRCWDSGPYPELLRYEGPPPGELSDAERQWCTERLKAAGLAAS